MRLQEYCQEWLGGLLIKPQTRRRYESVIRVHILPELGRLEMKDLGRARLRRFIVQKSDSGLSMTTVCFLSTVLRSVLDGAIEDGYLSDNHMARLMQKVKLVKRARNDRLTRMKALTYAELERLLAEAWKDARNYYPIATLAWTGIRHGELIALEPSDVDLVAGLLHITKTANGRDSTGSVKTGRPRAVDIPSSLVEDLQVWILEVRPGLIEKWGLQTDPPRLFFTEQGNPLIERNFLRAFQAIVARAGLPKHGPHDLRHTYASLLLQRGESIQYVSYQLGHQSIGFTHSIYGRWLRPFSKDVLEDLASNPAKKPAKVIAFPTR